MEPETVTYTIILEQAADGGWSALVPDLPGLLLAGDTKAQLLADAPDAIQDYLDFLRDKVRQIPRAATEAGQITVTLPTT